MTVAAGVSVFGPGGGYTEGVEQGAKLLKSSWRNTNFPNVTQTVRYHYRKHVTGQGVNKSIGEYTNDALSFYARNQRRGEAVTLANGVEGIRIRTPGGGPGGIFTKDGGIVTFWYK